MDVLDTGDVLDYDDDSLSKDRDFSLNLNAEPTDPSSSFYTLGLSAPTGGARFSDMRAGSPKRSIDSGALVSESPSRTGDPHRLPPATFAKGEESWPVVSGSLKSSKSVYSSRSTSPTVHALALSVVPSSH
jgi:hypothetical protein